MVKRNLWYTLIHEAVANFGVGDQECTQWIVQTKTIVKGRVHFHYGANRRAVYGNKPGAFKLRPRIAYLGSWCTLRYCFQNEPAIYPDESHATGWECCCEETFHIHGFFKGLIIHSRGKIHLLDILLGSDVIVVDCTGISTRLYFCALIWV